MIVYNAKISEFFMTNQIPALYRSQDNSINSHSMETNGPLDWYLASRSMKPAKVSVTPDRHSGLGLESYCQATSPLRRFADLCLQRQAIEYISTNDYPYQKDELSYIGFESETRVKEIQRIESRRRRYWLLKYLRQEYLEKDKNNLIEAVVLENDSGTNALIELNNFPIRGRCFLPISSLQGDQVFLRLNGVDLWEQSAQFGLPHQGAEY
jgi:exoribonuclease-2